MNSYLKTAIGLAVLSVAGAGYAATTATTMAVSATVPVQCSVSAVPLNFGTISDATQKLQNSTISVTCGNGVAYNVAIDGGQNQSSPTTIRRMANGSGGFIQYDLGRGSAANPWGDQGFGDTLPAPVGNGTGSGAQQNLTVAGRTTTPSLPPPGNYSDRVTVTVHF